MDLEFLSIEFLNNSVKDYLYFGLIIVLGLILARPIISYLLRIALKLFGSSSSKSEKEILDSLLKKPLHYFFLLMILYVSSNTLSLPQEWDINNSSEFGIMMIVEKGFYLAVICTIFWSILRSIEFMELDLKRKLL